MIRGAFLVVIAATSTGCEHPNAEHFSCNWRGAGQFSEYATDADARLSDGRLMALRIVSKVGVIPDRSEGTCVYDLREQRFEHVIDDDGMPRLRFVNERNEGTGYLDYHLSGDRLIIKTVSSYACAEGSLEFPIDMSSDPNTCQVGEFPAR